MGDAKEDVATLMLAHIATRVDVGIAPRAHVYTAPRAARAARAPHAPRARFGDDAAAEPGAYYDAAEPGAYDDAEYDSVEEACKRLKINWYPGHIAKAERQLSEALRASTL